ncbi:hypothetical protein IWX49DRAFT_426148 [Phyllosticta citricarpa]
MASVCDVHQPHRLWTQRSDPRSKWMRKERRLQVLANWLHRGMSSRHLDHERGDQNVRALETSSRVKPQVLEITVRKIGRRSKRVVVKLPPQIFMRSATTGSVANHVALFFFFFLMSQPTSPIGVHQLPFPFFHGLDFRSLCVFPRLCSVQVPETLPVSSVSSPKADLKQAHSLSLCVSQIPGTCDGAERQLCAALVRKVYRGGAGSRRWHCFSFE